MKTKREIERKYEGPDDEPGADRGAEPGVGPGARPAAGDGLPDLTRVPSVAVVRDQGLVELDAVYYDTADRRLAAHRTTLRRRTGGLDAGWHLKLPVSSGEEARDEIHAPFGEEGPDEAGPPAALAALVRSRARGAPLVPVVRLRSARRLSHLVDASGALLAEVSVDRVRAQRLDGTGTADGADAHGGPDAAHAPRRTARWTETEVELADGVPTRFLDEVEPHLLAAGRRPSRSPSKLARALAETAPHMPPGAPPPGMPSAGTPPPVPPAGCGRPAPGSAAAHVLRYLAAQRDAIVELDADVRRDLPDSVHRMRVATRRVRSVLASYRGILDRAVTDPVRTELKWLAAELGLDRDREVLAARLSAGLGDLPPEPRTQHVRARLARWSDARRSDGRRRLTAVLDGGRYLNLLTTLDALLADPPTAERAEKAKKAGGAGKTDKAAEAAEAVEAGKAGKVLGRAVRRDERRLAGRLDAALRLDPGEARDTALHTARKAAKRLRYTAEAATPVLGSRARGRVARAKRLQSVLGDHQDSVLARRTLLDLAAEAHAAGEDTFPYGLLYGREEKRAARDERKLTERKTKNRHPKS